MKTSEVSGVTGFAQLGLRYLVSPQANREGAKWVVGSNRGVARVLLEPGQDEADVEVEMTRV